MRVNKGLLAFGAAVFVSLLIAVAYLMGTRSAPTLTTPAAAPVEPASVPTTPVENVSQPVQVWLKGNEPINACYHLESCNYWRIASLSTVWKIDGSRLVRASLQPGEVKNPAGTPEDDKHIVWGGAPKTFYAYCSTTAPRIAWQDGAKYVAEDFDFAGEDGIPGVQQDDANIYQALCHGFFNNELADKAASLGYKPLPDGARGQVEIDTPDQLASTE